SSGINPIKYLHTAPINPPAPTIIHSTILLPAFPYPLFISGLILLQSATSLTSEDAADRTNRRTIRKTSFPSLPVSHCRDRRSPPRKGLLPPCFPEQTKSRRTNEIIPAKRQKLQRLLLFLSSVRTPTKTTG